MENFSFGIFLFKNDKSAVQISRIAAFTESNKMIYRIISLLYHEPSLRDNISIFNLSAKQNKRLFYNKLVISIARLEFVVYAIQVDDEVDK